MELLRIIGAFAILRAASPAIFKWSIAWPIYTLCYGATFSLISMITLGIFSLTLIGWCFIAGAIVAALAT